jgi:hypothetical protein
MTEELVGQALWAIAHGAEWEELPEELQGMPEELWVALGEFLLSTYVQRALSTVH